MCTWVRRWSRIVGVICSEYHRGGWKSNGSDPESATCGTLQWQAYKQELCESQSHSSISQTNCGTHIVGVTILFLKVCNKSFGFLYFISITCALFIVFQRLYNFCNQPCVCKMNLPIQYPLYKENNKHWIVNISNYNGSSRIQNITIKKCDQLVTINQAKSWETRILWTWKILQVSIQVVKFSKQLVVHSFLIKNKVCIKKLNQ